MNILVNDVNALVSIHWRQFTGINALASIHLHQFIGINSLTSILGDK